MHAYKLVPLEGLVPYERNARTHSPSAWYLDTRKPHTAVNAGATERIHLVMDVESSPELLALLNTPSDGANREAVLNPQATEPMEQLPSTGQSPSRGNVREPVAAEPTRHEPDTGDARAAAPIPDWRCGDSRGLDALCADVDADFIFSCPPYADLERYSDDPADISTLEYTQFLEAYRAIIAAACRRLRKDRFACFVVGDVRGEDGEYRGFVADTIRAFTDAGLRYYNEAILVTATGSLALRAGRAFSGSRKLGKTHQNVLVFVKGYPKRAAAACGEVEIVAAALKADGDGAS